ncbi:MAG: DNA polymerase III subunit delta, partial [Flavobacteriales bacterium]
MEHLRILKDLQLKQYKPVYFLSGEEPYFIDEITHFMEEHVLDEISRTFGQTIVYGRDVQLDQLIGLAKGFPMMGDLQLVIVKEAQDMKEFKSKKDNDEESDLKLLMNYIENP